MRSMSTRKFWSWVAVLVLKPTKPSLARSIDGVSTLRAGVTGSGRPMQWLARSPNTDPAMAIASVRDRSMCSPTPVRRARAAATTTAGAPYNPPTYSARRPPACTGSRDVLPRKSSVPDSACTMKSVAARSDSGPPAPNGEIDSTTRCGWRARTPSTSKFPGPKLSTTMSASPSSASTCASPGAPTTERLPALR